MLLQIRLEIETWLLRPPQIAPGMDSEHGLIRLVYRYVAFGLPAILSLREAMSLLVLFHDVVGDLHLGNEYVDDVHHKLLVAVDIYAVT